MPAFVILLRAVNVGATGKLPMADFRRLLEGLGYGHVETYIQSGNAVVDANGAAAGVERAVARALLEHTGTPVPVVVRNHDALTRVIAGNPFDAQAAADGSRVHAMFLSAAPAASGIDALAQIVAKYPARRDRFHLNGDTLYLHLPDGAADSKFTTQAVDRALGVTSTARNWNTVLRLHALSGR
jgi:uncharacterized protein (DUF1697 family)